MPEIERKWLLNASEIPWDEIAQTSDYKKKQIIQQYLRLPTKDNPSEERIRKVESNLGIQYYKATKSYDENQGMIRDEREKEISEFEFYELYDVRKGNIIEKIRHAVTLEGVKYEIDIYKNLKGLVTVEVEFDSKESAEDFRRPCWFGREVTEDSRYKNVNLARNGLQELNHSSEEIR